MEEKKCPVDRGKLLIGLECCRRGTVEACRKCPYWEDDCNETLRSEELAYINYLEAQLGVTG